MKQLILIVTLALSINAYAQEDKTVTLTVSGQGKTQDEAKQVALRSAIEQAFGAFISSKTEILNDNLVKDEIVSVTNGNIQKFDVLSEVQLPDGGYATTLKAIVSVTKLTSFCESKGLTVEFKGGIFAINIKIQQLNESNEVKSVCNFYDVVKELTENCFDYTITPTEPQSANSDPNLWTLGFYVGVKLNNNFNLIKNYFIENIKSISMSDDEVQKYKSLNLPTFPLEIKNGDATIVYRFRKEQSLAYIQDFAWYFTFSQANFIISDGVSEFSIYDYSRKSLAGTYGGVIKTDTDLQHLEFKYGCNYKSDWNIYHIDPSLNPPWGIFRDQAIGSRVGCNYAITKENFNRIRISKIRELERLKVEVQKMKEVNPTYYDISNLERGINDRQQELNCFADSNTVFIWRGESLHYGYAKSSHYGSKGNSISNEQIYLVFDFVPPMSEYLTFSIGKYYTTEELSKVSAFKVKPGKL